MEELGRRQGVTPVSSIDELAHPEFFASDEEHDEFLRELRRWRRGVNPPYVVVDTTTYGGLHLLDLTASL